MCLLSEVHNSKQLQLLADILQQVLQDVYAKNTQENRFGINGLIRLCLKQKVSYSYYKLLINFGTKL